MTCEQARAILTGSIGRGGPLAVTRAERSAVGRHMDRCKKCRRFLAIMVAREQAAHPVTPEQYRQVIEAAARLAASDRLDPEYQ